MVRVTTAKKQNDCGFQACEHKINTKNEVNTKNDPISQEDECSINASAETLIGGAVGCLLQRVVHLANR